MKCDSTKIEIFLNRTLLEGELSIPRGAPGVVLFAHGCGSSHHSPRNRFVAERLHGFGIGTLLFDLLTPREDEDRQARFDIDLLTRRLIEVTGWIKARPEVRDLALGYFGASTGAAAALRAAAAYGGKIKAIVSRGGRPDLAGPDILAVRSPTLLIVGERDTEVLQLNQDALKQLGRYGELQTIPGAGHLFEESHSLEQVALLAGQWFAKHLAPRAPRSKAA
jgi:putative phosphoribosyl transferase